jgi:hypothetical protein
LIACPSILGKRPWGKIRLSVESALMDKNQHKGRVLIAALADICLRRYIEKTCQGHGELSLKIQFQVPILRQ